MDAKNRIEELEKQIVTLNKLLKEISENCVKCKEHYEELIKGLSGGRTYES